MRSFKKFVIESIEQAELDEAVEVRHDRYMRSHGKKASGGTGSWMFTHKAMGDVDHKNEKEVYSAPSGKFSDAKKAAQQWAKKHGHSTVYVMESVELDEVSASTLSSYVDKARADKSRQQKARTVAKNDYKKYGIPSDKERADAAHRKASQRNTGISMAKRKLGGYTKGTEPKVLAREEVELDEQAMTFQNAEKLKNKHLVAMDHHKKNGNSKGYSAHSMVVRKFEDAYDRHGTGVIPAARILAASQKAFKDHPHSGMKESVELDEARKSDSYQFTHKPGDADSEKRLADLKKSVKGTGKRVVLQGRLGKDNPNAHKYSKNAPRAQYKDGKRVNSDVSGKSGAHSHQRIQKADAAHHDVYVYDRRESFELDEVSDKKLDAYRQKAFADQPSGDDGSDKYRKRKFGRDLAFAKQTGRAKVLATKEEVELDEAAPKIKPDFVKTQREKDAEHAKAMGRSVKTGRKLPMTSTQRSLASMRKEEVELTESHFKIGDRVKCIRSGMFGEVIKSDKPEVGKYYTVRQDSGKVMKYAPDELKKV